MPDTPAATTAATPSSLSAAIAVPTVEQLEAALAGAVPIQQSGQKLRYEFGPNTVYEGDTPEEVLDKIAKAHRSATEHIQTLQSENRTMREERNSQVVPARDPQTGRFAPQQAQVQPEGEFDSTKYYALFTENPAKANAYLMKHQGKEQLAETLSEMFGIPADQLVDTLSRTVEMTQLHQDQLVEQQFSRLCPDFPFGDKAAVDSLIGAVKEMGGTYNPKTLQAAHHMLVAQGTYKPTQQTTQQQQSLQPMPLPPQGGQPVDAQNIYSQAEGLSAADLRRFIESQVAKGTLK